MLWATASFVMDNPAVNLAIGTQGIHVGAFAAADDGGGAVANALVDVVQENLVIGGDVTVTAAALSGSAGEGAGRDGQATANLSLIGSSGNVSVLGQTLVTAVAHDTGAGNAIATALVGIVASAGEGETGGNIALGSLFAVASADDQGAGSARALKATRRGLVMPVDQIADDVGVVALAHGAGAPGNVNRGASADAELYFGSSGTDSGAVDAVATSHVAHGINDGSGRVNAEAEFSFADIRNPWNSGDVTIVAVETLLLAASIFRPPRAAMRGGDVGARHNRHQHQPRLITGDITLGANAFKGAGGSGAKDSPAPV